MVFSNLSQFWWNGCLMINDCVMKVESIAEGSHSAILLTCIKQ